MDGFVALYIFMLAGVAGYVVIAQVPSILHTPLMSGSNFIHGVVLAGAMLALGHAEGALQTTLGFLAVVAAAANAVGGYVVTDRMLAMFRDPARQRSHLSPPYDATKDANSTPWVRSALDDDDNASNEGKH